MARLVLLACLMLTAASVYATHNRLDVEHCSEECSMHCGKKQQYTTGKCIDKGSEPGSYMASCTPNGAWKIEDYAANGCSGAKADLGGDTPCVPFPKKLPVSYSSKEENNVKVNICELIDSSSDDTCDGSCQSYELPINDNCEKINSESDKYYTATVNGESLTLGLYDDKELCAARVAPVFYKEGMTANQCATYRQSLKGTCTPITRTKTVTTVTETSNSSSSSSSDSSSSSNNSSDSNDSSNNSSESNDSSTPLSAVSGGLVSALFALVTVFVALF